MSDERPRESLLSRMTRGRDPSRGEGDSGEGSAAGRRRRERRKGVARPAAQEGRSRESRRARRMAGDDDTDATPGPRTGVKRTVVEAIRQIPSFLQLLVGLMTDGRVSRIDKVLVVGALAYIVSPLDFIPDVIPFLGETDDLFLVVLAVQRLIDNAGRRVLLDHWRGHPDDLSDLSLGTLARAAGFFLPGGIRAQLKRFMRR